MAQQRTGVGHDRVDDGSVDLLIVGAGSAGLMAAHAAAECGARVLLLEKSSRAGGTLYLTGGSISAGGTRRQCLHGIDDSPEAHFDDIVRIGGGPGNPALAELACQLLPNLIDWLEASGLVWESETPAMVYGHEPYRVARTHRGMGRGQALFELIDAALLPHIDAGRVSLRLDTSVDALLVEQGRVVGVRAGAEAIRAQAVLLATGGFGSNPTLFAELASGYRPPAVTIPEATGDGLTLARGIGADLAGVGTFTPSFSGFVDPNDPTRVYQVGRDDWQPRPVTTPQVRPPWELWVNRCGERFIAEDFPSVDAREHALKAQSDLSFFIVWDAATLASAPSLVPGWTADTVRSEAQKGTFIVAADSPHALGTHLGMPGDRLAETIATYNRALESGINDPFGRLHRPRPIVEPPFYGMKQVGVALLSWAGVRTDGQLRVVRPNGSPIVGLYAVGEVLGAHTFMGKVFCGGMSLGPALALGKFAGTQIASAVLR